MTSIAWLIFAIVMFIFEAMTVGLVCIWFGLGALVAYIVSLFTDVIIIQLIVFVIATILSFIVIKPIFKKFIPQTDNNTNNTSRLIGRNVKVIKQIDDNDGRVLVGDVSWIAKSNDNSIIEVDTMVKIIDVNGNTLTVKKLD